MPAYVCSAAQDVNGPADVRRYEVIRHRREKLIDGNFGQPEAKPLRELFVVVLQKRVVNSIDLEASVIRPNEQYTAYRRPLITPAKLTFCATVERIAPYRPFEERCVPL